MAPASKRSTTAELSLINLKTGLVNLPASLEAILLSVNTVRPLKSKKYVIYSSEISPSKMSLSK